MITVQHRGQNHQRRAKMTSSIKMSSAMARMVPSEQPTVVMVTELVIKLSPSFILTYRFAAIPSSGSIGAGQSR